MGRDDFAAGVSRDLGQQTWMPHSLARIHWLEGWDGAKQQGFQQTTFDFGDIRQCNIETDQSPQ